MSMVKQLVGMLLTDHAALNKFMWNVRHIHQRLAPRFGCFAEACTGEPCRDEAENRKNVHEEGRGKVYPSKLTRLGLLRR